jgi:hypothetical protein
MSRIEIDVCPLCGDQIQIKEGFGFPRRRKDIHGFCAEIGYSRYGWGNRQDFFPSFSMELCPACWSELSLIAGQMAEKIKALRGSRAIKIDVTRHANVTP